VSSTGGGSRYYLFITRQQQFWTLGCRKLII
jgi:hypothetical protein